MKMGNWGWPGSRARNIAIVVGLLCILAIGCGIIFIGQHAPSQAPISQAPSSAADDTSRLPIFTYYPAATSSLIDTYGVFASGQQSYDYVEYYDDGVITSGKYAGDHRLIARVEADMDILIFFIASKDDKHFIVYGNPLKPISAVDPDGVLNRNTVTRADRFPINFPEAIPVGNYVIVRTSYVGGNPDMPVVHALDIASPEPTLKMSYAPVNRRALTDYLSLDSRDASSSQSKLFLDAVDTYAASANDIWVEDDQGVNIRYTLMTRHQYDAVMKEKENPDDVRVSFENSSSLPAGVSLFASYGALLPEPGNCGGFDSTYILKNIRPDDLDFIGTTTDGIALFAPKDPSNTLNTMQYWANRVAMSDTSIPFATYARKHPALIAQDPWGNYIGFGKMDYHVPDGCGKPVIYLYPTATTSVTVGFVNPIHIDSSIPQFTGEWAVLAEPSGVLHDLQPSATNCSLFSEDEKGFEYARQACARNDYPYLYWSGRSSGDYPEPSGGWYIDSRGLESFFDAKLHDIGFTRSEARDFEEYWIPYMRGTNAPYFRISFLTTEQMNEFIPMHVTPQPDSALRVFMDWSPMDALPQNPIDPQTFKPFIRHGFVYVEWGGLKI